MPLTAAERRAMLDEWKRTPLTFNIIEKKTHAGTLIDRELPERGGRVPSGRAADESYGGAITGSDLEDLIAAWEE